MLILAGHVSNKVLIRFAVHFYKGRLENRSVAEVIGNEETSIAGNFTFKNHLVDINGMLCSIMGMRYMNNVELLENGHGYAPMNNCSDDILKENAANVTGFSKWCTDKGVTFTFAQVPYKRDDGISKLPDGFRDYSDSVADRFKGYLLKDNVDYIDLREVLKNGDKDFYSYFYKTEHHWNSYGAFEGFVAVANHISDMYEDEIEAKVLDISNYQCDVYENNHLGHYGDRTGKYFLKPEDFYLLYPKFYTEQSCLIPHKELKREGSFYEAIFEKKFLNRSSVQGMYASYIGGDFPLVVHESKTAATDKCIMVFCDSFGTIVHSLLSTVYKKVIAVDLRWVKINGWEESAVDFINIYNPDHVVMMYNPNQLSAEKSEQFSYGLE